jgi:hypothetical protein
MSGDFKIEPGAEFTKVFDVFGAGQVVVQLATNEFGNASFVISRADEEGIHEVVIGIKGARVEKADRHFVEMFAEVTGEHAYEAWKRGVSGTPANDLG